MITYDIDQMDQLMTRKIYSLYSKYYGSFHFLRVSLEFDKNTGTFIIESRINVPVKFFKIGVSNKPVILIVFTKNVHTFPMV